MRTGNRGDKTFMILNVTGITLLALIAIFPYLNTLAVALNHGNDTIRGGITIFPRSPTLANFKALIANEAIIHAFYISVLRVGVGTLLALVVQFSAAYTFTNPALPGRTSLLVYFIVPLFFSGGLIPTYLLYSKLGLLNNFWVYVLPGAFVFFNMIVMRTYLYTIPDSLKESARIDGAGELGILVKIVLPLSMPIIATISLWTAVTAWNDWTTTLNFVTNPQLFTLSYKLEQLIKEMDALSQIIQDAIAKGNVGSLMNVSNRLTPESVRAAQVIVTTLPIILVYPFLQKYFIKGVLIGSVKE